MPYGRKEENMQKKGIKEFLQKKDIVFSMKRYGIEPYNEDTGAGFMRHAVVRVGHSSGEVPTNAPAQRDEAREIISEELYDVYSGY